MTTVRTHAYAQRTYTVEVTPPVGNPVALRVRGMTLGGAGAVQPKPSATPSISALSSTIKTALGPTTNQPHAHVARVMPVGVALELPGPMQTIANAAQALPDALKGVLVRGAVAVVGPRLAALALPTVTLAAALYPRQMGDASLPVPFRAHEVEPNAKSTAFVPLAPHGLEHAEGFKPVNANDPKLYGPPPSEFTRPPTPPTWELPQTHTTTPEPLEGGPRVDAPTVPGKAQHVASASDYWLLAEKVGAVDKPERVRLTFSDVEVSDSRAQGGDDFRAYDKRLHLKFQTSAYGEGEISVWWPDPFDRSTVQVDFKKTSQLPDGPAGEILAHALGYTRGFIPKGSLQLKIENVDTHAPAGKESVSAVMRWAVAMHGRKASSIGLLDSGYAKASIESDFRAAPRFFEKPNTHSGHTADGPALEDPEVFVNLYPWSLPLSSIDEQSDIFPARDLTAAVQRTRGELPEEMPFIYVIPVPAHAQDAGLPYIGFLHVYHREIAQGRSALGAGYGHAVYDPNFGPGGGYRSQFLTDITGQFAMQGKNAKKESETAFQKDLDTKGRWFSPHAPVSIEPFAGLQVRRESAAASPTRYEIKIPDARALSYKGGPLQQQTQTRYADLASMVIEPVERQAGQLPLARISKFAVDDEMWGFLPTFVGQALNAVRLTHPVTGKDQAFGGILISREVFGKTNPKEFAREFVDGLTVYGLEKKLGKYSPEVPFVLQRKTESGDIELTINPAVRTSR